MLDLFSGIGGFSLAGSWCGIETAMFCEIDPFARQVLAKNFPGVPIHGDIRTLTGELVGDVDLITGGFPCQPFSVAGKRLGTDDDRHLWPEMARLVGECRPRWVLGENVAGFVNVALDDCLADLESLGYEARAVVVPACAVGAWHRRDRVWIVAHAESPRGRTVAGSVGHSQATGLRAEEGSRDTGRAGEFSGITCSGGQAFDPDSADGRLRRGSASGEPGQPALGGEALADADSVGRDGRANDQREGSPERNGDSLGRRREAQSGVGESAHGLPGRMARPWDGAWESGVSRVVESSPDRVNKLKALGNSIVPQVAYEFLRLMAVAA